MAIIPKKYAHLNAATSGSDGTVHKVLDAYSAYVTGSLTAKGAAVLDSTLAVAAQANFANKVVVTQDISGSAGLHIAGVAQVIGASYFTGDMTALSTLAVDGNVEAHAALAVTGLATIGSTLDVAGKIDGNGALDILGESDLRDVVRMGSNATVAGTLGVTGATSLSSTLGVTGAATLSSTLAVTGAATLNSTLHATGNVDFDAELDVDGAVNFDSTLHVDGAVDFDSTLDVEGAIDGNSTLNIQGASTLQGAVRMNSTLLVDSNADVDGAFDVAGASALHGAVTMDSTLTVGSTANIAGNFSVATNKFTVAVASGNTSVAGDLVVAGNMTVVGDRIEAQIAELKIEDGLITLMSGSTGRSLSNNAGFEVEVGSEGAMPSIKFADAVGGASGSWVSNLDWVPSLSSEYDLGIAAKKWRNLELSGQATMDSADIGGTLDVTGQTTLTSLSVNGIDIASQVTIDSAGVAIGSGWHALANGDFQAANGIFTGDLQVNETFAVTQTSQFSDDVVLTANADLTVGGFSDLQGVSATDIDAATLELSGILNVEGITTLNAALNVEAASNFNGAVQVKAGHQLTVVSHAQLGSLLVQGSADFDNSIDVLGSGSFTGDITADNATIATVMSASTANVVDLNVGGTATFNGVFSVPGGGSFGSLQVAGINMSPIFTADPVDTTDDEIKAMLTQSLAAGEMGKYEVEVMAKGTGFAATWKISIAAIRVGANLEARASELTKEYFGELGAKLDVEVETSGANVLIKAKGAEGVDKVYWDCQITKKMVMGALGVRTY